MDCVKEIDEMIKELELDIKPKENNKIIIKEDDERLKNPIIAEYVKKYKPEELTDDLIPTIDTQLRELKVLDDELDKKRHGKEEQIYRREMLQRVKCLALNKMGKNIFTNTNDLSIKDRQKLQNLMWEYNDIDHKEIIKEFNNEFSSLLDDVKNIDYSKLPVYNI